MKTKMVASFVVNGHRIFLDTESLIDMETGSSNLLAEALADNQISEQCEGCGEDIIEGCLTGELPTCAPTSPCPASFVVECGNLGCEETYDVEWRLEEVK